MNTFERFPRNSLASRRSQPALNSIITHEPHPLVETANMQDRIAYQGITFDDVLLEPGYSEVLPRDVDVKTKLTRNIRVNIPIVSSPMDTVTESALAIALAQEGGMGIIHKT
jgi:IMP dehydrogenase/GMP reductase